MKTVLVVEDTDDLRELFIEALTQEGYTAIGAENGEEALEVLRNLQEEPCLVLLDMMMPVMDGATFVRTLHHSHRLAALPVVLVSAENIKPGAVEGVRGVVKKPVEISVLHALVRDFCGPPKRAG
jgi:CheY-like chemotaxis protein